MRERHWSAYLRLLPGGDNDVTSALAASGILYLLLFLVTLGPSYYYGKGMAPPGIDAILPLIGAGALPALVLAAWTGLRIHRSQPLRPDDLAASLVDDRTWRGDRIARVPKEARIVPTGPRYLAITLADGSRRRLWYRVGHDSRQLLRLARRLRQLERRANDVAKERKKAKRQAQQLAKEGEKAAKEAAKEAAGGEVAEGAEVLAESASADADASADASTAAEASPSDGEGADEGGVSEEDAAFADTLLIDHEGEASLELLVEIEVEELTAKLLPDPAGVEACLRKRLDEAGVVLTRTEPW